MFEEEITVRELQILLLHFSEHVFTTSENWIIRKNSTEEIFMLTINCLKKGTAKRISITLSATGS